MTEQYSVPSPISVPAPAPAPVKSEIALPPLKLKFKHFPAVNRLLAAMERGESGDEEMVALIGIVWPDALEQGLEYAQVINDHFMAAVAELQAARAALKN